MPATTVTKTLIPKRTPREYAFDQESKHKTDSQRSKLYASERRVFKDGSEPQAGFESLVQIAGYMDSVIFQTNHWEKYSTFATVQLGDGRGRRKACYKDYRRQICLPLWARTKWVILHELAHTLTDCTHGNTVPAHGGIFTFHYIGLVSEAMSPELGHRLRTQFEIDGVQVANQPKPIKNIKREKQKYW